MRGGDYKNVKKSRRRLKLDLFRQSQKVLINMTILDCMVDISTAFWRLRTFITEKGKHSITVVQQLTPKLDQMVQKELDKFALQNSNKNTRPAAYKTLLTSKAKIKKRIVGFWFKKEPISSLIKQTTNGNDSDNRKEIV